MESLIKIQQKLKAPKNQKNSFGGYNYRSAEDILEAVKPLLAEVGAVLTVSDELVFVGNRYYIKATARYICEETIEVSAYAREPETKKGMDDSQITGTASSYARKYALNGLFLIDDTKDADTDEYRAQTQNEPKTTKKTNVPKEQPNESVVCPCCGKEMKPITGKDGTVYAPADILKKCGGVCFDCYRVKKVESA